MQGCSVLFFFAFASALLAACADAPRLPPTQPAPPASSPCLEPVRRAIAANEGDQLFRIDVDGAIAKYGQANALAPSNHRIVFKLAMAQRKKENWSEVAALMERATALAPGFASYWMERGNALEHLATMGQGRWEDARAPFERCIQIDPNFVDCHEELGTVLDYLDDEAGALASYTRAIVMGPTVVAHYAVLADLYLRLDRVRDAEVVLEQALAFAPPTRSQNRGLYGVHVLRAQVYQDRGAVDAMIGELEQAKALAELGSPEALQMFYNLGSTYIKLKPSRTPEAIVMLKAFFALACKGTEAARYATECETTVALVTLSGGAL